MAGIVDLCEGVRDLLNNAGSGVFSEDFTAVFDYVPTYTIPDMSSIHVVVTDAGGEFESNSRRLLTHQDTVRIVLMWRVADSSGTGVDSDLMSRALTLLQEISNYLFHKGVGDYKQFGNIVRGDGDKDKSHFYPGNIESGTVFAADISITYVAHYQVS